MAINFDIENFGWETCEHYFVNFVLQGDFSCRWVRVGAVGFIHQFAVTNSMHLQSTYTPYLQ